MVGYFHKKIFELNTTPKHFECKLSKHLWEVGLKFEYASPWMKHDHHMYALSWIFCHEYYTFLIS